MTQPRGPQTRRRTQAAATGSTASAAALALDQNGAACPPPASSGAPAKARATSHTLGMLPPTANCDRQSVLHRSSLTPESDEALRGGGQIPELAAGAGLPLLARLRDTGIAEPAHRQHREEREHAQAAHN